MAIKFKSPEFFFFNSERSAIQEGNSPLFEKSMSDREFYKTFFPYKFVGIVKKHDADACSSYNSLKLLGAIIVVLANKAPATL